MKTFKADKVLPLKKQKQCIRSVVHVENIHKYQRERE